MSTSTVSHAHAGFQALAGRSLGFWLLLAFFGIFAALGGLASLYMEHNGHWVTGMNNQVPWGLPHACAVFLLVASTGALNIASLGSVFSKDDYRPLGRLSALSAMAVQAGGLFILLLDLGRADRLVVAMTNYNFTSIFCLNIVLYNGFFAIVTTYLYMMMEPRLERFYRPVAFSAFVWRLAVTTGTGSIFGLMVSRMAFHSAIMAPLFIALSLSFGLAMFVVILALLQAGARRPAPSDQLQHRLVVLLAVFVAVSLYMVVVHHVTSFYSAERRDFERYILFGDGVYPILLWVGFGLIGSVLPLLILLVPVPGVGKQARLLISSVGVIGGGVALMYAIIVGGESFPIDLFPGKLASSTFFDGVVGTYTPSTPEIVLSFGGFALVGLILMIGLWVLELLPSRRDTQTPGRQS
ncbi:NrfD/PsrC family molybdoenzyme membrane anchor subunit [Telmatospirillum sp.]|uniref:NrfD/PsrC family molybdoenzyme membrane anchor subunit n=1 Tax=Telmatospirillum sp. TaxID=2079197 RepID=UPI0028443220|nr:NrfD/PsrC family molybdoenzyme membrane anchor subunit [Telmatospirillum sp.]MDR3437120.1 polysulfide reductase NrfD [Telmatospirillum sp.]